MTTSAGCALAAGKERSRAIRPCLDWSRSGSVSWLAAPMFIETSGDGGGEQERRGQGQRERRAGGHDAGHAGPEAALAGAAALRPPAHDGHPERVDPVAQQPQEGGEEGERPDHGHHPDEDGPGGQAAHDRARHDQQAEHGQHEGAAAEEHGPARRPAGARDRLQARGAARALLRTRETTNRE